jgi:hypothetical protein
VLTRCSLLMLHWASCWVHAQGWQGRQERTLWLQADASGNGEGTGFLVLQCPHSPGTDAQPLHPCHMTGCLSGGFQQKPRSKVQSKAACCWGSQVRVL